MNKIKKVCGGAYFFFVYYLRKDDNRGYVRVNAFHLTNIL